MAKYLNIDLVAGEKKTTAAINSSAGVADADKIIETDAAGILSATFFPNIDTRDFQITEDVVAGDFINLYEGGMGPRARLADASNGREAHGYVKVTASTNDVIAIYFEGENANLSALTSGLRYYLSNTTPGGLLNDISGLGSGEIYQYLGTADGITSLNFEGSDIIDL